MILEPDEAQQARHQMARMVDYLELLRDELGFRGFDGDRITAILAAYINGTVRPQTAIDPAVARIAQRQLAVLERLLPEDGES